MTPFEKLLVGLGFAGAFVTAGYHSGRHALASAPTFSAAAHEKAMDRIETKVHAIERDMPRVSDGTPISGTVTTSVGVGGNGGTFIDGTTVTQSAGRWNGTTVTEHQIGDIQMTQDESGARVFWTWDGKYWRPVR